jgi:hypothetical protein
MDIRQELRIRRFSLNIKVKEIADYLGCSIGLISNWEHGRSFMGKQKIEKYKEYLEVREGGE